MYIMLNIKLVAKEKNNCFVLRYYLNEVIPLIAYISMC